jgi:hypothetical protein
VTHSSLIAPGSGQPLSRADGSTSQKQRRRQSERTKAAIYALVDAREGNMCRLTGRTWNLEHHHLQKRSQGGKHTTANVVLLHRESHRDIEEGRLTVEGNADEVLIFRYRDGRAVFAPVRHAQE